MREVYLRQTRTIAPQDEDFEPGIAITHFPCELGRHQSCDFQIDHPFISRRHCSFSLEDDDVWVRDLKSRNGTYLNGEPVVSKRVLQDGDVLHLAHVRFSVRLSKPGAALVAPGRIKNPYLRRSIERSREPLYGA